ncbi:MAG TPA: hypothetical protein VII06_23230 [Chloroflexota bacterium]|jgi:hypothetical protein
MADQAHDTWDAQAAEYRARWEQRHAAEGGRWEDYAPAYALAWRLAHTPGIEYGRSWADVAGEFERRWEQQGSTLPWERVSALMREVWAEVTDDGRRILGGEHRAPTPERHAR